ncbi:MAG: hypothetical protein AVDCRST_MAG56-5538 [uncultured Cytophagales bacterium]|uniref:Uncharacterized protein n=1 Tax=uncultured Cytophagales bacterium TaxID=158755 RepID=A0A6J4KD11_9SPHI|nr:MAG: hypothetical protein AVDCRST_MAG56-5538 [uncultured Cytophagales bacterium]
MDLHKIELHAIGYIAFRPVAAPGFRAAMPSSARNPGVPVVAGHGAGAPRADSLHREQTNSRPAGLWKEASSSRGISG